MPASLAGMQNWMPSDCHEICPCLTVAKNDVSCNFEKRRQEALSRGAIVKLTWIILHGAVICGLFSAETSLSGSWRRPRFLYITAYIFLVVTNLAFFIALCIANPGYLQKGVHALSLSTMKRDSQNFADNVDIAEQGIGGLAHVDLFLGRRLIAQKDKVKHDLDRTVTMPSLPSQRSKILYESHNWHDEPVPSSQEPSTGEVEEASNSCVADKDTIFLTSSITCNTQVMNVRTRGPSLGGVVELYSVFQSSNRNEITSPLLGDVEKRMEGCSGLQCRAEDSCLSIERRSSKPVSPVGSRRHEKAFQWWEGPSPGRWCEFCGAWQLLRSRHCHDCARCVRRFDHHCNWIGSCVGQDNHLLLWWYLTIQVTLLVWTLKINFGAFGLPVALTLGRTLVLLYCLIITFVMTVFVALLLIYHTYLVITAQTTFELMLGHATNTHGPGKVPYLRHLPVDARPFSLGIIRNILDFCCLEEGKTYQMPAALSARKSAT